MMKKLYNRETISYLICGAITTVLGISTFGLFSHLGLSVAISNTIATLVSVTFAYFINKVIVFRSISWAFTVLIKEIFTFITGRFATYVMETLLLILLINMMGFYAIICKVFTNLLVIVGNYLFSKKVVFK